MGEMGEKSFSVYPDQLHYFLVPPHLLHFTFNQASC